MDVILIGMPGAGKSTVGRILADRLDMTFVDTDDLMADRFGPLQDIIDLSGLKAFHRAEETVLAELKSDRCVVATGGSAVYSPKAMTNLSILGPIVWLKASLRALEPRVGAMTGRGVARRDDQTLADLLAEREPLYKRYAQLIIDTELNSAVDAADEIAKAVQRLGEEVKAK
jgi:shikimate kinase